MGQGVSNLIFSLISLKFVFLVLQSSFSSHSAHFIELTHLWNCCIDWSAHGELFPMAVALGCLGPSPRLPAVLLPFDAFLFVKCLHGYHTTCFYLVYVQHGDLGLDFFVLIYYRWIIWLILLSSFCLLHLVGGASSFIVETRFGLWNISPSLVWSPRVFTPSETVSPVYSLVSVIFLTDIFLQKREEMREPYLRSFLLTLGISIPIFKILWSHKYCLWETWGHFESEYGFLGPQFLIVMAVGFSFFFLVDADVYLSTETFC